MEKMDFYQRIAVVGAEIPVGKVTTYGQLALLCGKPNNSRQIGYALNRNKMGCDFPAYKVVNGQGYLAGAAAFSHPDKQRKLLQADGIEVIDNRVSLKKYGWQLSFDEVKRFYNLFLKMKI